MARICVGCGKTTEEEAWGKGQYRLFGTLFACGLECAWRHARHALSQKGGGIPPGGLVEPATNWANKTFLTVAGPLRTGDKCPHCGKALLVSVSCLACLGRGDELTGWDEGAGELLLRACPTCGGTGRVLRCSEVS